jgi:signal transduction histidine kinase
LYVARLDAGRISLRKETVPLAKLVRAVLTDQKQAAADRGQTVDAHLPKDIVVTADPRYLRMVFENLLSNAIKYTPEGGSITLSADEDSKWVSLSVTDTGVGLETKHINTIFDKFTRVENILSTDVNGSGVGLYLTKEIITLHDGTIDVSSTLGSGSTFTVKLPKDTDA